MNVTKKELLDAVKVKKTVIIDVDHWAVQHGKPCFYVSWTDRQGYHHGKHFQQRWAAEQFANKLK